jgi:hypothetical protein
MCLGTYYLCPSPSPASWQRSLQLAFLTTGKSIFPQEDGPWLCLLSCSAQVSLAQDLQRPQAINGSSRS